MQEIKTILSVDTGSAPKTVKELKDQIKNLQDALVRADEASDEYKSTLSQLVTSQSKLQSIMKASKSDVTAVEGSYNALNATMRDLQKQWKATGDEVERNRLGAAILDINNQLKDLDSSIGNNQRKVGSYTEGVVDAFAQLRSEIKQYKAELLTLEEGTEQYNQTLAKLGNAQFKMKDINEQAMASVSDFGEVLGTISRVGAGLVGGFNAIQGVMALTGTESEALEETMVKLQAGMAIVQGMQGLEGMRKDLKGLSIILGKGVTGVKTFIKSLSGIKMAIAATGIGVLVVAIGALVANWDKLKALLGGTTKSEVDKLNESLVKFKENLTERDEDLGFFLRLKEAAGASREEILRLNADSLYTIAIEASAKVDEAYQVFKNARKRDKDEAKAAYEEAQKYYEERYKLYENAIKDIQVFKTQQATDEEKAKKKAAADAKKQRQEQKIQELEEKTAAAKELTNALLSEEQKRYKELREQYEKYQATFKGDKEMLLVADQWYWQEHYKITEEYLDAETEKVIEQLDEQIAAQNKAFEETQDAFEKRMASLRYLADMQASQKEATAYNKSLKASPTEAKDIWGQMGDIINGNPEEDAKLQAEIEYNNALLQIQKERFDKQKEIWEEEKNSVFTTAERKIQIAEETALAQIEFDNQATETQIKNAELVKQAQQQKLNKIEQSITGSLGVMSDVFSTISELSAEGSKEAKGFAIAAAVMDTLGSAVGAYKSTVSIPYVGPILAPIAAATALAAGYAQVKKIQSTDEKTGNGGMGSSSVGVTAAIPSDLTSVSYTRNLMGDTETEELNKSQQVYILESDIQESGKRVEVRDSNTNF